MDGVLGSLGKPEMNIAPLITPVLSLQFVAFGWRIQREISVGDAGRRTWFPISDVVNTASMFAIVSFCVVVPIGHGSLDRIAYVVLAVAYTLLAFHPLCLVGHYRLFTRYGRKVYLPASIEPGHSADYPYCTGPELAFNLLGLLAATIAGAYVWTTWGIRE